MSHAPRLLLIDNYDSFTYNLVQAFLVLGADVFVHRNDAITVADAQALAPTHLCISPGPGTPRDAGVSIEMIRAFAGRLPVLGVCLGHQSIVEALGGDVVRAGRLMHGKVSKVEHDGRGIFAGLPQPFDAGRYHSLIAKPETLPAVLEVSARTAEGEIMGVRHKEIMVDGVQFHPESILTPDGPTLMGNFLASRGARRAAWGTTGMADLRDILERLLQRRDLGEMEAGELLVALTDPGVAPAMSGALLAALRSKGVTADEVRGFAGAMRSLARHPVLPPGPPAIDIVGTGGDASGSFNLSTGASLLVAAMGVRVIKHGNRSVSSRSGSADLLEALGLPLPLDERAAGDCLAATGFTFLFAPHYHPATKEVAPVRRTLGVRTVFNLLGPLTNPAEPPFSLIGAYSAEAAKLMADTLAGMSIERAFVIHGEPGWDEATPVGPFELYDVRPGVVRREVRDALDLGMSRCTPQDLAGGDAAHNAAGLRAVFGGRDRGPHRDAIVLNTALALEVAGAVPDAAEAVRDAGAAIDRGDAVRLLERLAEFGRRPLTTNR